ncbi:MULTISPECIES: HAD-IA family hydrolase [Prauserella salsuginis group]|uniref:HAD-IA family hydrolase n=1 Tax=Prauserella salsuginis TaxID=387889 RepID=A0ABW6G183_9PSEU|nr:MULTISPECIES: HAD-IA family hydrolase [Prauserella salsuginis group]MCR3722104.1 2-haloacid dehalogenase [Prauserella flava]MCR3736101.1 2-haloacid dehalogenase [Prauserella salsuginis]
MSKTSPIATFDCYRTLIDFDLNRATLPIVRDTLDEVGIDHWTFLDNLRVMRFHAVAQGPYTRYQDIVADTLECCMVMHGARYRPEFAEQLLDEARRFPVFPEVPDALETLKASGVQLAIISNSDNDFIRHHVRTIGVDFDYVVTAEDAGWYKPRRGAFDHLFSVIDRDPSLVTHVAQGWDYDIMPTKQYGIRRVWINRYGFPGSSSYQPYFEIPDLLTLPDLFNRHVLAGAA